MNKEKQRMFILIGPPGAGKSTYAESFRIANSVDKRTIIINKDKIRLMFNPDYTYSKESESTIHKAQTAMLRGVDCDVILDNTNCRAKGIKDIIDENCKQYTFELMWIGADKSLDELIDINRNRPISKQVPVDRIASFYQSFKHSLSIRKELENYALKKGTHDHLKIGGDESYNNYPRVDGKLKTVLVDIDGTLAHKLDRNPFDWKLVGNDELDYNVSELVQTLRQHYVVIYVSGRSDECREETLNWLKKYKLYTEGAEKLYMRKAGDFRKDTVVKKEIYQNHIQNEHDVRFVLDDRNCVVEMWRELGIKCLQVEEGNF